MTISLVSDGIFEVSESSATSEAAIATLLTLGPLRVKSIDVQLEQCAASVQPPAVGVAPVVLADPLVTSPAATAAPQVASPKAAPPPATTPLKIKRVIVWHDIENAPLPSSIIVRDAAGHPVFHPLPPGAPPGARRLVRFKPLRPDGSDDIRGGIVINETLRAALACTVPEGASHPSLVGDGTSVRHSLAQVDYRIFLHRNTKNPFHPSDGECAVK